MCIRDRGLSYFQFTVLSATAVLAQILTLQKWGVVADRFGSKRILSFCAKGVAICPLLWLPCADFDYLIGVQLFAGFMWAGFNLSASTFLFDAVSAPKIGRCVAYQAVVNAVFVFGGSLLGAALADGGFWIVPFEKLFSVPASPFLTLFVISGVLRFMVVGLVLRIFKEVRNVEQIGRRELFFRIAHVRPLAGIIFRPIALIKNRARRLNSQGNVDTPSSTDRSFPGSRP